ncbi:flagellar hook-associated protein FlgK [Lederbergia wuyishanensis]|uniref:Flagellar hook-associated protein 1 n=1 Tax=Lederbergia wuyishanensis TaxID=1347903 RepID=A0ABU0D8U0_9BACI|nr:flagellar hook-associated protein FlgK [Lederbergia wuyishanensis]MCJ8007593.1 flagellar hook-associated protein FlgK [Lederbergia wuyishanensis]MDQ0344824.1 flagellar hook-associated protein 1 FlgK [Lederbergia wuyishanensis]
MRSTFMGLETAKRGMYTQQSAIYVTGHNISNANTPGYTRQRVNFEQTTPYPAASLNRPQIPGQLGTGVKDGTIQRIRDRLVDEQFRGENNQFGFYESLAQSISKIEDVMNEPSDNGLSKAMAQFWQSLQDLSTNPENEGARRVVIQRGTAVVETFQYLSRSLTTLRNDTKKELDATVREINNLATQIASINKQISEVEPHGYLPNDLYDERDRLIDQLSKLVPIEATDIHYGGNSLAIAEGGRNIFIVDGKGQKVNLVQGNETTELIDIDGLSLPEGKGKLAALIYAYGNEADGSGLYPEFLDELDKYAYSFAQVFNAVHKQGFDLVGDEGVDFFSFTDTSSYKGAASSIHVSITLPLQVAASSVANEKGNGQNALELGKVKDIVISNSTVTIGGQPLTLEIPSGTLQSFYEGLIGKMAVKGQQANRLYYNTGVLLNSVENNRKSISEVSLDEEFSNLIQFQHAYAASARMISVVDEMLEKIINGMGIVGR